MDVILWGFLSSFFLLGSMVVAESVSACKGRTGFAVVKSESAAQRKEHCSLCDFSPAVQISALINCRN